MTNLRSYQSEALSAIETAYAEGKRRQLVVLPTGTGKTVLFVELVKSYAGRRLIIVHRDELVRQTVNKLSDAGLSDYVGIVKGDDNEYDADIVVASVQTLSRPDRLEFYRGIGRASLLVIDEAHHAPAPTYRRVVDLALASGGLLVGFTATPDRATSQEYLNPKTRTRGMTVRGGMAKVFEHLTYYRSLVDMVGEGWLCDVIPASIATDIDLDSVSVTGGDWSASGLGEAIESADAYGDMVKAWLPYSDRPTLAFLPTVETSLNARDAFRQAGVIAEHVDGTTPIEDRQAIYRGLRDGKVKIVTNCMVLTEGFDEPSISCVIVARPTQSRALFAQMIGRGARLYPGKDNCVVLSVVSHDLDVHPITLQTFLNDPGWDDGKPMRKRKAYLAEFGIGALAAEAKAFTVKFDANPVSHAKFIWRKPSPNRWVLLAGDRQTNVVNVGDDRWEVYSQNRRLGDHLSLSSAIRTAEDYVARDNRASSLVDPNAKWRADRPSNKQLALAVGLGLPADVIGTITKGECASFITTAKLVNTKIDWKLYRQTLDNLGEI